MGYVFLFWLGFAIVVGVAANTRGRSGFGWFLLALIISPLIAGLLVLALPSLANNAAARDAMRFRSPITGTSRTCPHCEQPMSATASVCTSCLRESQPMGQEQIEKIVAHERKIDEYKRKQDADSKQGFTIMMLFLGSTAILLVLALVLNGMSTTPDEPSSIEMKQSSSTTPAEPSRIEMKQSSSPSVEQSEQSVDQRAAERFRQAVERHRTK